MLLFPECSSGGRCLSVEYTERVGEVAKKHGLKLHIDGARIFNASVVSFFVVLLMIWLISLITIKIHSRYTLRLNTCTFCYTAYI
jgi:threonine aldolase